MKGWEGARCEINTKEALIRRVTSEFKSFKIAISFNLFQRFFFIFVLFCVAAASAISAPILFMIVFVTLAGFYVAYKRNNNEYVHLLQSKPHKSRDALNIQFIYRSIMPCTSVADSSPNTVTADPSSNDGTATERGSGSSGSNSNSNRNSKQSLRISNIQSNNSDLSPTEFDATSMVNEMNNISLTIICFQPVVIYYTYLIMQASTTISTKSKKSLGFTNPMYTSQSNELVMDQINLDEKEEEEDTAEKISIENINVNPAAIFSSTGTTSDKDSSKEKSEKNVAGIFSFKKKSKKKGE